MTVQVKMKNARKDVRGPIPVTRSSRFMKRKLDNFTVYCAIIGNTRARAGGVWVCGAIYHMVGNFRMVLIFAYFTCAFCMQK